MTLLRTKIPAEYDPDDMNIKKESRATVSKTPGVKRHSKLPRFPERLRV